MNDTPQDTPGPDAAGLLPVKPERYKLYWATVAYHRTDDLRQPSKEDGPKPVPENGERVLVRVAWMMDEDDPYPGEFAFLVEVPEGYHHWLPQRDLKDLELHHEAARALGLTL